MTVKDVLDAVVGVTAGAVKPRVRKREDGLSVGHILDRRHQKGKIRVPEDRKALPEVPTSVQLELDQLGEDLRSSLQGLDSDII